MTYQEAEKRVKLGFFIHSAAFVGVVGGLMIMNFSRHPEKPWSLWVLGGWGLGVALHAAAVFLSSRSRERMVTRTMHRVERRAERRAQHHGRRQTFAQ